MTETNGAGPESPARDQLGAVRLPRFTLPFSRLASDAARNILVEEINPTPAEIAFDLPALRLLYAEKGELLARDMLAAYPVSVEATRIGNVPVHVVTPPDPDTSRILICLHGGAFMWGDGGEALAEAVPVAAIANCKVIAVDYRLAPEHLFPAAVEDSTAVYRALLADYSASAIGIYGASAGGVLTGQVIAALDHAGDPRPGAIAMLAGGGSPMTGDSVHLGALIIGHPAPPLNEQESQDRLAALPYFMTAKLDDPRVVPSVSTDLLTRFPPTLLIAGSRDFAASGLTWFHRQLEKAGVDAKLFVFDGLWHGFHLHASMPESHEAHEIMARFFRSRLELRPAFA